MGLTTDKSAFMMGNSHESNRNGAYHRQVCVHDGVTVKDVILTGLAIDKSAFVMG